MAENYRLDSLCAIVDVNGLGQSRATQFEHDMEAHRRRWDGFGWHAIVIDGHQIDEVLGAFAEARRTKGQPSVILARTEKGKGVSFLEGKPNWHGKALKKGDEMDRAIRELESQLVPETEGFRIDIRRPAAPPGAGNRRRRPGAGLQAGRLGGDARGLWRGARPPRSVDPRIVALDADVKNSTFTDKFEAEHPERLYQCFIAEQAMLGAAMGMAHAAPSRFRRRSRPSSRAPPTSFACSRSAS